MGKNNACENTQLVATYSERNVRIFNEIEGKINKIEYKNKCSKQYNYPTDYNIVCKI